MMTVSQSDKDQKITESSFYDYFLTLYLYLQTQLCNNWEIMPTFNPMDTQNILLIYHHNNYKYKINLIIDHLLCVLLALFLLLLGFWDSGRLIYTLSAYLEMHYKLLNILVHLSIRVKVDKKWVKYLLQATHFIFCIFLIHFIKSL